VISIENVGGDSEVPYSINDNTPLVIVRTNENADCRASLSDESYDLMNNDIICGGDGGTTHTCQFTSIIPDGSSRRIYVACQDTPGNKNTVINNLETTIEIDTLPPEQESHNPSDGLTITTTSPTIGFNTNEDSRCRWSLSDQAYSSMSSGNTCDSSYSSLHCMRR